METTTSKTYRRLIILASIAIPVVVAALFGIKIEGFNLRFLPPIYAGINATTAIFLILALVFIKQKKIKQHELMIKICMFLSLIFLACYVAYHITTPSTMFGDTNHDHVLSDLEKAAIGSGIRLIYFLILATHIILSIAVVPMALFSFLLAKENKIEKHRKLAKITWPIWFYVAVSGVIVFYMISPFYK